MAEDWTSSENEAIVIDYFSMLRDEHRGKPVNKSAHRRSLLPLLNNRNPHAVEYKHRNISAILAVQRRPYIEGYLPADNFQKSLEDAIERFVDTDTFFASLADSPRLNPTSMPQTVLPIDELFEPPPEKIAVPATGSEPWKSKRGRRIDFAQRDALNRHLGKLGEEFVIGVESRRLQGFGRDDLAAKIEWVSQTKGDGTGYDILSFDHESEGEKLIEVKTTGAPKYSSFYVSRNEVECSEAMATQYYLTACSAFLQHHDCMNFMDRCEALAILNPPCSRRLLSVLNNWSRKHPGKGDARAD